MAELGANLLIETLPKYLNGEIKPKEQDHNKATFTKKFTREDGKIDWSQPAEKIYNQIRALNPEPGTWTTWNGKTLNIKKTEIMNGSPRSSSGGAGKLKIKTLQMEGKKEMALEDFLNGHPDFNMSQLE